MDILLKVFTDLGANQTLFIQFLVVLIMYLLSKLVFINRMHKILDARDDKTSKLEGSADKQFDEIKKLQDEYKTKIHTANKEINSRIEDRKNDIAKSNEAQFRAKEQEINAYIEESKKEVQENINDKREQVMGDAEQLAQSLVQKITKGA
ncbi:MAG: hypothetical protein CME62_17140 [Halobacteriovoraceae bacterium]|nr:hypothetical protein [Halobacteriovoraceae bacterium]|tara:strand:+ start:4791 stop:5240 length:450 start_codon:yes stop_codon:yes gene_type:complete